MRTDRFGDNLVLVGLAVALMIAFVVSLRFGAVDLSIAEIYGALQRLVSGGGSGASLNERILLELRLPRAFLSILVGASLGVGGTLMQSLFRNPIVEPGLIGISNGAALGSALFYVLGGSVGFAYGFVALPFSAFVGGLVANFLVVAISHRREEGRSSIIMLLLTGLAVNALFLSGIGFLSYIARDAQARSITFWSLGTLSGANWPSVAMVTTSTVIGIIIALRYAKRLNALMLGETEASYLGVNVTRLKWAVLSVNVLIVAVATAFTGVISFVGLIVPHLLRMTRGADNRFLILGSALAGALLLTLADLFARVVIRPAELPIGIVTTVVGAPVFIYLLRRTKYIF